MSTSCGCFRFWLDDDEGGDLESLERRAQAEHLMLCPDCREEMKGIIAQRATLRAVFRSGDAPPPLPEALVERWVRAMRRAASERDEGQSAG